MNCSSFGRESSTHTSTHTHIMSSVQALCLMLLQLFFQDVNCADCVRMARRPVAGRGKYHIIQDISNVESVLPCVTRCRREGGGVCKSVSYSAASNGGRCILHSQYAQYVELEADKRWKMFGVPGEMLTSIKYNSSR